jgi:hypothetical protein
VPLLLTLQASPLTAEAALLALASSGREPLPGHPLLQPDSAM